MKNTILSAIVFLFLNAYTQTICIAPTETIKNNLKAYRLTYKNVNHLYSEESLNTASEASLHAAIESGAYIFVKIGAQWCQPCRKLEPIIKQLAKTYTNILFIEVDFDQFKKLAETYGVRSLPTILFFNNGSLVKKNTGFKSKNFWEAQIITYFN